MPTVRLDMGYDGSGFNGYARQDGLRTVQGVLESALTTLLGMTPATVVAGRTDSGVHAHRQVVSFEVTDAVDAAEMRRSLNGLIGPEISVISVGMEEPGFHARHSAVWRRYRYRVGTTPGGDPITRSYTWEVGRTLDTESMRVAAAGFLGEHDFSSFCRSVEGRSNVRQVLESDLITIDEGVLEYWVRAGSFCQQMVRSLMGHLYDIGRGFAEAAHVDAVLVAKDRSRVATVAPPHGLTLWDVGYAR